MIASTMPPETSPINDPAPVTRPTDGIVYVSGAWRTAADASISVFDHGLLYGDGVFEGIRIYGGKIFKLAEHLERLYDSAHAIWMTVPMPREEMAAVTEEALKMPWRWVQLAPLPER